jgi:hypothetical protein
MTIRASTNQSCIEQDQVGHTERSGDQKRAINAHIWPHSDNGHYVEPSWCSARLFEEEQFDGSIYDPCCGFGTIVIEALKQGKHAYGSDLVDRGWDSTKTPCDFLTCEERHDNIVCNPPFHIAGRFIDRALHVSTRKVAAIFPTARLNAAHWLHTAPLKRIYLMTPRPSMPPGHVIASGEKPGGGKMDYCWLIFEHGFNGVPELRWLKRDKQAGPAITTGA